MAEREVRVALIQQTGLDEKPERNLDELLHAIDRAAVGGVDLVMPTELALTPYFCAFRESFRDWAEPIPGRATEAVAERARAHETTIVLPLYHADPNGRGTNVAVVIGPDGELVPGALPGGGRARWFTKVHLPASEAEGGILEPHHFSPGDGFPVFATPRAKLGILICYDRRFPEAGRTLALAGAEIILVPGCVPAWNPAVAASSGDMLVAELRTRAVENLVFVGACIRAGRETLRGRETRFVGRSCLIGPGGTLLDEAPMSSSCILRHTFGLGDIEKVRRRLPLLRDRRPELYFTGPEAGSR